MERLPSSGFGPPCSQNASPTRVGFLLLFLCAGMFFVHPCRGDSGGFDETGSINTARYSHTATLLSNGKVLFAGGDVIAGSSAELYDPASGTWTATGSLVRGKNNTTGVGLVEAYHLQ